MALSSESDWPTIYTERSSLTQSGMQQSHVDLNTAIIAERELAIADIEQKAVEANEAFHDFAGLVAAQQPLVDSIEQHINSAAGNTKAAVEEIRAADKVLKKGRKKLCIALGIVAGVVVCIGLVIVVAIFA
jgi:t-SNARE complex subunit (syntaxin)